MIVASKKLERILAANPSKQCKNYRLPGKSQESLGRLAGIHCKWIYGKDVEKFSKVASLIEHVMDIRDKLSDDPNR